MSNASSAPTRTYTTPQRYTALAYGMVCHGLFAAAIASMALALFQGMRIGHGPFRGPAAAAANLVLLLSFPLVHSWCLSDRGRRILMRLAPMGLGRPLSTTVFATISSAQLLAVFQLWSPSQVVWWQASPALSIAIGLAALSVWALLMKSMWDAQLGLQTGFMGWGSVFLGRVPNFKPFATKGLYRHVRQPIYVSFTLLLWLTSTWTPDQLVIASLWTGYCLAGSAIKERRYLKYFGEAFAAYQKRVPFWVPLTQRAQPQPAPAGPAPDLDVLVAGGGPVGLLLATALGRQGLNVWVVERRTEPPQQSMAIGITPPSMAILETLGVGQAFAASGVPIKTARVFEDCDPVGSLDFSGIAADHRYILSLPQSQTIEILERNLRTLANVRVIRGSELTATEAKDDRVTITLKEVASGALTRVSARYLAGCDGHRSRVRQLAGLNARSHDYAAHFLMADYQDHTGLGREAHLYFGRNGSVESFPLPDGRRRWITSVTAAQAKSRTIARDVAALVRSRSGFDLSTSAATFESYFRPHRLSVRRYVKGRITLCGDAAHVMSPIGGQGMNTGFADAHHLAHALTSALRDPATAREVLAHYHTSRQRAGRIAADRAARGMWLGTRTGRAHSALRRLIIGRVLLRQSMQQRLASYFAMLTIPNSPWTHPGLNTLKGTTT